jgi:hypothetical protein
MRLLHRLRGLVLIVLVVLIAGFWIAAGSVADVKWVGVIVLFGVFMLDLAKPARHRSRR